MLNIKNSICSHLNLGFFLVLSFLLHSNILASDLKNKLDHPYINAKSAVVMDQITGSIIYEKNPNIIIPPASLTKLVTLHIVFEDIYAGKISLSDIITIDQQDAAKNFSSDSSLAYLVPGQKISLLDLMKSTAVISGNDAAFALARYVAGSSEAFTKRMNTEVSNLGLQNLSFVEPSGLSENNTATAIDFANFFRKYINLHPESLKLLHSLSYMKIDFPINESNLLETKNITLFNRNRSILNYPGVDGVKSGFIRESGYNLAATARQANTRFIVITLGGSSSISNYGYIGGNTNRDLDCKKLFTWAFNNWETKFLTKPKIPRLRIWYGKKKWSNPSAETAIAVTLPRGFNEKIDMKLNYPKSLIAPVKAGTIIGEIVIYSGSNIYNNIKIITNESIEKGNFFTVFIDKIIKLFSNQSP